MQWIPGLSGGKVAEVKERVELYLWVYKACPRVKLHDRVHLSF